MTGGSRLDGVGAVFLAIEILMAGVASRAAYAMPGVAASFLRSSPPPAWAGWASCAAFAIVAAATWRRRRRVEGGLPVESVTDAVAVGFGLVLVVVAATSLARLALGG